jgi:hypothetical protein
VLSSNVIPRTMDTLSEIHRDLLDGSRLAPG